MTMTDNQKTLNAARLRVLYALNNASLELQDNGLNNNVEVKQACRLAEHLNAYLYVMKKIMAEEKADTNWR